MEWAEIRTKFLTSQDQRQEIARIVDTALPSHQSSSRPPCQVHNLDSMKPTYHIVWIATGKPYGGAIPPSHDEHAVRLALTQMLETVSYFRGKVEVRRVA